jgi:transposase-like protein
MALDQFALLEVLEVLKAAEVDDRIRQAAETIYQALIEAELTAVIGAFPHQRTQARTGQRNGYRPRTVSTTAGDLDLKIPRLRTGSFFPSLLERRRRVDQSLFAVIMEAYLHGTSTRKVDDLVKALGADTGISKSEVSRICADLDTEVAVFRDRTLAGQPFPYVFLDATYCKARVNHRVVSSWTPPSPRAFRDRRNAVQNAPSSRPKAAHASRALTMTTPAIPRGSCTNGIDPRAE